MVFSPKYRGKVLVGDVAMLAEAIIRKTCKERDIKIIDMSVSSDHIHLFIQCSLKYSVSFIDKRLRHGSVGHGWEVVEKYIAGQDRKS